MKFVYFICFISILILGSISQIFPQEAKKMIIERSTNPWAGLTKTSEEEEKSLSLKSVDVQLLDKKIWQPIPLSRWKKDYLLYRNEKERRLVLNKQYFSSWNRLDATKDIKSEGELLGNISNVREKEIQSFVILLLKCHLIQTYWHIESELELKDSRTYVDKQMYYFSGVHRYYTNQENIVPLEFGIQWNDGKLYLVSGPDK
jgi:hypothetical protein